MRPPAAKSTVPWRIVGGAVIVRVHLTPRAKRAGVDGIAQLPDGAAVKARVSAIPEDGKANAALESLLADALGRAKRDVAVTSGHTSRLKSVTLTGDAAEIIGKLEQLIT